MRAAEKRSALSTVFYAQNTADTLRNNLRALGDTLGPSRAKDVDALCLKLGAVLDEAFVELAQAPVDAETRTPEQEAADARAAAVKGTP